MNIYGKKYPREHLEECVRYLVGKYPACFFEEPEMRRPLKVDIVANLHKDGAGDETIAGAIFYMNNFGYQRSLLAGAERVDLNGKRAGVVTKQEQLNAEKWGRERKEEYARKNGAAPLSAVAVLQSLQTAGRISTDQLSKVTLPATLQKSPVLTRLKTLLASTDNILIDTQDEALRSALASASLKLLIAEAQKVMASLDGGGAAPEVMEASQRKRRVRRSKCGAPLGIYPMVPTPGQPEAAFEFTTDGLFVLFDGRRIAQRGKPNTPQAKT
jgi:hypothetical protein